MRMIAWRVLLWNSMRLPFFPASMLPRKPGWALKPSLSQEEALYNAPDSEEGRFRVPRIVEMD